eukprot:maker-scaffold2248_size18162-snap-gene-0.6 protein:Tk02690 transcript:maker-scaffold2248_size18162-snap-gene-0.6-mRNA-1 annotation:"conserved hypothetical protein"
MPVNASVSHSCPGTVAMDADEFERTILVKPEVFVYKIPPRPSARGYRAADWNLSVPDWTGRLRCVSMGKKCAIRLEDKNSGELFAECPVEEYPGVSVESVTDSSRYFILCIRDSGRKAYIGIGFSDRSDSFDLNVALQDHFKWVKREVNIKHETTQAPKPNLDLAFKEGQTIRISIPKKEGGGNSIAARPKAPTGGILPPPPGGLKLGPPPGSANLTPLQSPSESQPPPSLPASSDLLGDFFSSDKGSVTPPEADAPAVAALAA